MESKPKSIRAIRHLRKKQPKAIEGVKQTMFVRGNKTSDSVMGLMKDLRSLRRSSSAMFSRKHDIHPFESRQEIEKICKKSDTSLFLFGSHTKKRPSNIVLGRTYEHKVLDMVELGVVNFKAISEIVSNVEIPFDVQPFIFFQGDLWESNDEFKKLKNLISDFFLMNNRPKNPQLDKLMRVVVCWSVTEDAKIFMNVFQVAMEGGKKLLEQEGNITIEQLGPNSEFKMRRQSFADTQTMKKATFVPKPKKKKENKNIRYDRIGNKEGRVYLDRQNLRQLPFKKRKPINKGDRAKEETGAQQRASDEFGQ